MKKKVIFTVVAVVLFLAILFAPIPQSPYDDGGTREYTALTYKIVDWNRMSVDSIYDETKVYWFPDNFKSVDELWEEYEAENMVHRMVATVLELGKAVLVRPVDGEEESLSYNKICIANAFELGDIGAKVGSTVEVYYTGGIMETYPAQIHALKWNLSNDMRHVPYMELWMDKEKAEKCDDDVFDHIIISQIYADCFFAYSAIPLPWTIKLNGTLSEDWCVGDQVICTYENTYFDSTNNRYEADLLTIEVSDWQPDPNACYKPVVYLYPQEETMVSVELMLDGKLTCTYPAYHDGWNVTAAPDGTLTDAEGQTYNYLYWEGQTNARWDMTEGFCIKGEDTAAFLETALEKLGLTRREANEFIVYWLPLMECNPYNIISFQTDVYTDAAKLQIDPSPDTLIRIFMAWEASDDFTQIPEQELTAPERTGFTVVEWGGTQVQ